MDCDEKVSRVQYFVPLVLFIIILVVGGFCFQALDGTHECHQQHNLSEILFSNTNINSSEIEKVVGIVEKYYIRRSSSEKCRHLSLSDWFYFTGSLLLTIDYPDFPITNWGKLFTVIFLLIGLPVSILTVQITSQQFTLLVRFVLRKTCFSSKDKDGIAVIEFIVLATIFAVFFCITAVLCKHYEHADNYADCFYLWFLALLTIGEYNNSTTIGKSESISIYTLIFRCFGLLIIASFASSLFNVLSKLSSSEKLKFNKSSRRNKYVLPQSPSKTRTIFYINEGLNPNEVKVRGKIR